MQDELGMTNTVDDSSLICYLTRWSGYAFTAVLSLSFLDAAWSEFKPRRLRDPQLIKQDEAHQYINDQGEAFIVILPAAIRNTVFI